MVVQGGERLVGLLPDPQAVDEEEDEPLDEGARRKETSGPNRGSSTLDSSSLFGTLETEEALFSRAGPPCSTHE